MYFFGEWNGMKVGLRTRRFRVERFPRDESENAGLVIVLQPPATDIEHTHMWLTIMLTDILPVPTTRLRRDDDLVVEGDTALAGGLLTSSLSRHLEAGDLLLIDHRQLGYQSDRAWDEKQLMPRLWTMTEAAARIQDAVHNGRVDTATLLNQVFNTDQSSSPRARAFKELWRLLHAHNPELRTQEESHAVTNLLQLAWRDKHPEVRLAAALATQNVTVGRQLAEDPSISEPIRKRALEMVLDEPNTVRLRDSIRLLLDSNPDAVVLLGVFAVIRKRELQQALLWLKPPGPSLRADAANSLLALIRKWLGPEGHELLKALALHDNKQVAADAIGVLADTADGTWIPWLKALTKQRSGLKHSVDQAIAEIAERHALKAGALSVVEPAKAGQLAITEGSPGALSDIDGKDS